MSGDFFQGYAIGHGTGVNQGQASVDTDSYVREGIRKGRVHETNRVQAYYVKRLMRHLAARNSQKQALMSELKKYAPEHPYLNPEPVETTTTALLGSVSDPMVLQQVEAAHVINKKPPLLDIEQNREELSRLLVHATDGTGTTKGDLAMVSDGSAFVAENMPDEVEAKIQADFLELNPDMDVAVARAHQYNKDITESMKAAEEAMKAAEKAAKAEKEAAEKLAAQVKNERLKAAGVGFLSRTFLHHE